jgi:hypothetical protein
MLSRVLSMVLLSLFQMNFHFWLLSHHCNKDILFKHFSFACSLIIAIQIFFAKNLMCIFFSSCYLDVSSPHPLFGNSASFSLLIIHLAYFKYCELFHILGVNMRVEERRKSIQGKKGWFFIYWLPLPFLSCPKQMYFDTTMKSGVCGKHIIFLSFWLLWALSVNFLIVKEGK